MANTSHDDTSVTISHGLLNPGDWIEFQILVDGAAEWPRAHFRIRGISEPTISYPTRLEPIRSVTITALPKSAQYVILVIASVATIVFSVASIVLFRDAFTGAFIGRGRYIRALSRAAAKVGREITTGRTPVKEARERLASELWLDLPSGVDRKAREVMRRIDFDPERQKVEELTVAAEEALNELIGSMGILERLKAVDWGGALAGSLVLLAAVANILILGGSWRIIVNA
ncbi:hypothetical protein ES703_104341 [subsurface metagenome]